MELRLEGTPASPGIVVGPVHLLRWEVPEVPHRVIADEEVDQEIERFRGAVEKARERLRYVHDHAERHAGAEEAAIFEAQLMILDDAELHTRVEQLITQNIGAARAFDLTMLEWRQIFSRHANPWMRERVGDITDIQIRVLSLLLDLPDHDPVDVPKGTGAILVTHDLTPSLTVQLDREAIAGIATDEGTRTSHVAILARSLGLPAVVGLRVATARLQGGEQAILDGKAGALIIRPSKTDLRDYRTRAKRDAVLDAELATMAGAEPVTLDGTRLTIRANVDLPEEAALAASSGADGVGLMRTESLVLGRTGMPDEDEQYRAYKAVVDAFRGQPVVIRTFDIGGDKLPVGGFPSEPNPFLGWRAIRVCLDQPEIFMPQLRALLRAAADGDVRILLPLVVSVDEVRRAREMLAEAAADLVRRGVAHRSDVKVGVMIETPASVISADSFVGEASFFSIGTNDLVQYTLAVDRGNANLSDRFTPLHPAVLRLIRHTVQVADAHGIELTICGEMGSNPLTAFALLGLGIRQLSVGPRAVARVKRMLRGVHLSAAQEAVELALVAGTAARSEGILKQRLESELGGADPS
jgi:phosphoenolpyruvate-protein phosphotransferase (PTS system enzyme I)